MENKLSCLWQDFKKLLMHFKNSMFPLYVDAVHPVRRWCASALLVSVWAFLPGANGQVVGTPKPGASAAGNTDNSRGTWVGSIGDQWVMVCLDARRRSAFYTMRDQVEIPLIRRQETWIESANGVEVAQWHLSQNPTLAAEGYREDLKTGAKTTIRLSRYDFREGDVPPCDTVFYKLSDSELPDARVKRSNSTGNTEPTNTTARKPQTVAAGHFHSALVAANGDLWMWGSNYEGLLGDGTHLNRPVPIKLGTDFSQVFAAEQKTAAIKKDGSLWTWFQVLNSRNGAGFYEYMIRKVGLGFVHAAVSQHAQNLMAVGQDGSLWAHYQLNASSHKPTLMKIGEGFTRAALGTTVNGFPFAAAVKADGSLWAWAYDGSSQANEKGNPQSNTPVKVGDNFVDVYVGWNRNFGVKKDGSLWEWSADGATPGEVNLTVSAPKRVDPRYAKLVPGLGQNFGIKPSGALWAWGRNFQGSSPLGDGTTVQRDRPVLIGQGFDQLAVGGAQAIATKKDGSFWFWGTHTSPGGRTPVLELDPTRVGADFAQVKTGPDHTLAIKNDGSLWAWGRNSSGQLGTGKVGTVADKPLKVGSGYVQLATGSAHSLALKKDGSLWGWGDNSAGQLGDGSLKSRSRPVLIGQGFRQMDASGSLSAAVKLDGSLWVWGSNAFKHEVSLDIFGPQASAKHKHRPIRIGANYQKVLTGEHHTLAIAKDGALWQWKQNTFVQREKPSEYSERPAKIAGDYVALSVGGDRSFGIKNDGTLWAWGGTYFGQLGNGYGHGMSPDQESAVQIGSDFAGVETADYGRHTLAIKKDGTLWGWGSNSENQLSKTSEWRTDSWNKPTKIGEGFVWVTAGGDHSLAIKSDGTLWGWGSSGYGQLGAGGSVQLKPERLSLDR